ncbi:hypothetical protein [Wolbachia endosymbiont of Cimex lectularius]|uniref:hypothetical protein n=1 Tax=Wolbachia endosymbiont of Cimex lectularius TaxID=246273 RepID=UPI00049AFBA8|nr:hypothetical protein [Wolbachia endosymbiont of Cimex lectularius]BAP00419.1 putative uncharacterized protein [Wolbachia endosymbiont of Cimex lectularius]
MTVQTQDQSIWKLKNTAHITKTTMEFGFAVAAVATAATVIYAAAKGVALSSALPAFLANPWVIAAIVSYVAIYFVARSISSYQQLYSMEGAKGQDGTPGVNGNDADFSALLGDAVKSGEIVKGEGNKLLLKLSNQVKEALTKNNTGKVLYLFSIGKDTTVLNYTVNENVITVDSIEVGETKYSNHAEIMKALGAAENATSLKVAVSNQDHETLKDGVSAKLADVAIEGAIKKATGK